MMLLEITNGARKILETDPHGWTLTIISVSVVFTALVILYGIYSLSGALFTGKFKQSARCSGTKAEAVAAIALALENELNGCGPETAAAIAAALEMETGCSAHDNESGIITIQNNARRPWAASSRNFRRKINR